MPKLSIQPILQAQSDAQLQDGYVTIDPNSDSSMLVLRIGNDAVIAANLTADVYETFAVSIEATADSRTAARLNKLLAGTGFPKVEKYHRTGQVMVRTKGAPTMLPAAFEGKPDASGWAWKVIPSVGAATPTPAPSAPDTQVSAPAQPKRAQSIKVQPAPTDAPSLFRVPSKATTHSIKTTKGNRDTLAAAWSLHQAGEPVTVMLEGPAGTGKTSIVDDFAAQQGIGVFVFDGAAASSWADWTGATVLTDGANGTTTRFAWSAFIEAIRLDGPEAGKPRMVLVDEVNRAESAAANNALMPILSQGRLFVAEANETVYIDPAVLFVFTQNRGYRGTVALDEALADRMWATIRMEPLGEDDEVALIGERVGLADEQARPLVKVAAQVRAIAERGDLDDAISTRSVLQAAYFVKAGLTLSHAAEQCWANAYEARGGDESERNLVLTAIKSVLG